MVEYTQHTRQANISLYIDNKFLDQSSTQERAMIEYIDSSGKR